MISSSEIPNEVEDKPPPAGCELESLKEKNLTQREEHSSYFCNLLQDEIAYASEERFEISNNWHSPIIIEDIHEPPSLATRKDEIRIHEGEDKLLQGISSEGEGEVCHENKEKYVVVMEDIT